MALQVSIKTSDTCDHEHDSHVNHKHVFLVPSLTKKDWVQKLIHNDYIDNKDVFILVIDNQI